MGTINKSLQGVVDPAFYSMSLHFSVQSRLVQLLSDVYKSVYLRGFIEVKTKKFHVFF